MNMKAIIHAARNFAAPFRVTRGKGFRLKDCDPGDTLWLKAADKPGPTTRSRRSQTGADRKNGSLTHPDSRSTAGLILKSRSFV